LPANGNSQQLDLRESAGVS